MTVMMANRTTFEESVQFGERFGLYDTIANAGPVTSDELACVTGIPPQQLERWLKLQVAGQYVMQGMDPERYQTWCDIPQS